LAPSSWQPQPCSLRHSCEQPHRTHPPPSGSTPGRGEEMGQQLKRSPQPHTMLEPLFQHTPACPVAMPPGQTPLQRRRLRLAQVCPARFQRMQFVLRSEKPPPISLPLPLLPAAAGASATPAASPREHLDRHPSTRTFLAGEVMSGCPVPAGRAPGLRLEQEQPPGSGLCGHRARRGSSPRAAVEPAAGDELLARVCGLETSASVPLDKLPDPFPKKQSGETHGCERQPGRVGVAYCTRAPPGTRESKSQNHGMLGVGRDLCGSPSPTP